MRKIILAILLFLLVAAGLAGYFFFLQPGETFSNNPTFKAVPIHSPLVIELPEVEDIIDDFSENNPILTAMYEAGIVHSFSGSVRFLKNLKKENPNFQKVIHGKRALISFNFEGKNEVDYIFLVSMTGKKEQNQVLEIIKQASQTPGFSERNYANAVIYKARLNNNDSFAFTFTNGIFVASREVVLVEEAIRQSNTESLMDAPDFVKLNKTSNSGAQANIYINHKTISQFLSKFLKRDFRKKVDFLQNFAERTELDFNLKKNELFLNGFTLANDSMEKYVNLFKKQAPVKSDIEAVLPSNTSLFIALNLEDPVRFQSDYEEYAKAAGTYYERETRLIQIQKEARFDFLKEINEMVTGSSAIVFTDITQNTPELNRFFLMELKSQSTAREKMQQLLSRYIEKKNLKSSEWYAEYKIDAKRSYRFYQFPYPDISQTLFGKVYSGVNSNWFTFFDNYMVFADSQEALKAYIHNLVLGETLARDEQYKRFKENVSSRCNFQFFINCSKAFHLGGLYLNDDKLETWRKSEELIRKFYAFSWQFSNTNGLLLNTVYLKYDPAAKEEPQTVWQTKLESNLRTRPQLVINHNDRENKEVIFQDKTNNLYLLNKEGVRLWKVKLSEPIISDIVQIDIYRNHKLQYLFNTQSAIHLIDRNGEEVKGYPLALRSPASSGLSVFDYNNNKDYRIFIACENKLIYAYDKNGKFVKGWNQFKTDNPVQEPIQHMRVAGKDYIVCFDRYKTYFLDRRGNIRLKNNASFEHSNNALVLGNAGKPAIFTTDKNGVVYQLFFDGSFKKTEPGKFSPPHFFTSADVNGNGLNDFIFADQNKLVVYSDAGKEIFSKELKKPITEKPEVFRIGNTLKIGVVSSVENRIYLFNTNGSLYRGFPLQGSTAFCLGSLSEGNNYFNLLVGNDDQSFFNYRVE